MVAPSGNECAALLLDALPHVMRALRRDVQDRPEPSLTFLQFRVLAFLKSHEGSPLHAVAAHFDLTPPTVSKTMEVLVQRGLVSRVSPPNDRRRVALRLTAQGVHAYETARRHLRDRFGARFEHLSTTQRATLAHALDVLRVAFAPAQALTAGGA